jgi:hypothetical protein
MPEFPTVQGVNGPIYLDIEGAEPVEYNIPVPLSSVFWGDETGLDSPPETVELAKRTLAEINVWEPHRGYLSRVRARLGIYDSKDTLGAEHLVQSHTGCIRVFPAVPADFAGGFENVGAQGAFVVSAKRSAAGTDEIMVESLAGNPCVIANPWPDSAHVIDTTGGSQVKQDQTGAYLGFATTAGHVYRVEKAAS